jgi:uncharacterized protein YbaR (Trm112 family)
MLRDLSCPHCGGAGLELQPNGQAACKYCGTPLELEGQIICPNCELINPAAADFCQSCRRPLYRVCPVCQYRNWSGAEHCGQCGQALDMLEYLTDRARQDTASRLTYQQEIAPHIKAQEEAAAQRQMDTMLEIEHRRQQGLAEARVRRQSSERIWMTLTALGGLGCLLAAVGAVVWTILQGR